MSKLLMRLDVDFVAEHSELRGRDAPLSAIDALSFPFKPSSFSGRESSITESDFVVSSVHVSTRDVFEGQTSLKE